MLLKAGLSVYLTNYRYKLNEMKGIIILNLCIIHSLVLYLILKIEKGSFFPFFPKTEKQEFNLIFRSGVEKLRISLNIRFLHFENKHPFLLNWSAEDQSVPSSVLPHFRAEE